MKTASYDMFCANRTIAHAFLWYLLLVLFYKSYILLESKTEYLVSLRGISDLLNNELMHQNCMQDPTDGIGTRWLIFH